ncbi:hypothetical protein [Desulfocucumis palustris]|uniref:hypothetical protein n=1 Tax=Desulfocucumis palustris TaxID=1898651 RepID=UPI0013FDDDBF|nr:hypothetical protein [Desulfocucumis palustris]
MKGDTPNKERGHTNKERGHTSIGSLSLGLEECPQMEELVFGVGGISSIAGEVIESGKRTFAERKNSTTL